MRKQLDARIATLINNNVKKNHRSFIVLVGDKGRDQVVNLHFLLSQARVSARPSVLWCYKKDLGFTTHRKKREAKIKRDVKRGIREPNDQNPFEIFVTVTDIRYTYYKESHKILGHTYGMLVLQDFEALTPNLLARTIETVQGGGLVVLLLKTMTSLRQLYTMSMDVHARYRTESNGQVVPRFNERFILSLGGCKDCLVLDDELNVLPISRGKDIVPLEEVEVLVDPGLKDLKSQLGEETKPAGPLVALTKTLDQAHVLLSFIDTTTTTSTPSLNSTLTLTASRGRGKSATLGLALASAVFAGFSNIFVTSPSPENLRTLFEFLFKGLDALGYEEHLDYDILQATSDELLGPSSSGGAGAEWEGSGSGDGGASKSSTRPIVRVNIFRSSSPHRGHRQTIQYIHPQDAHVLGQAELVVIDEAAAIPLPLVRNLIGMGGGSTGGGYAVWMASTVNGYEGTGRSLSLKLIEQLREGSRSTTTDVSTSTSSSKGSSKKDSGRKLVELTLTTPIRYSAGDQVEAWLNRLLCLDVGLGNSSSSPGARLATGTPPPSSCTLYSISLDTLFSYHPASETFLQRIQSLLVASHYKNQPNDLMMMSDKPGGEVFVLLPPLGGSTTKGASTTKGGSKGTGDTGDTEGKEQEQEQEQDFDILPHPLAVIQISYEGSLSKNAIQTGLGVGRAMKNGGDMIPWIIAQQYQEGKFGELSGARVVRVAVGEGVGGMGYGTRALQALNAYYSGEYFNLDEYERAREQEGESYPDDSNPNPNSSLLTDLPSIRKPNSMPPLLQRLSEKKPPELDYLGVAYGLTGGLLRFWKRLGYVPLYLRHTPSDLTGEHTCVMVRGLNTSTDGELEWLGEFGVDFRTRLLALLSFPRFREFGSVMGLSILEAINNHRVIKKVDERGGKALTPNLLPTLLSPFDLKRLESYGNNMLDYHVVLDLLPVIAGVWFQRRLVGGGGSSGKNKNDAESPDIKIKGVDTGKTVNLSAVQSAILLGMGLQRKSVEEMETELSLPVNQILALLVKIVRKIGKRLIDIQKEGIAGAGGGSGGRDGGGRIVDAEDEDGQNQDGADNDEDDEDEGEGEGGTGNGNRGTKTKSTTTTWNPLPTRVEDELEAAGEEEKEAMKRRERQREMINALDLRKYVIDDTAMDWSAAESQVARIAQGGGGGGGLGGRAQTVVSVKNVTGQKRKAVDDGHGDGRGGNTKKDGGGGKKQTRRGGKKVKR